jgi:hypothetical protein
MADLEDWIIFDEEEDAWEVMEFAEVFGFEGYPLWCGALSDDVWLLSHGST